MSTAHCEPTLRPETRTYQGCFRMRHQGDLQCQMFIPLTTPPHHIGRVYVRTWTVFPSEMVRYFDIFPCILDAYMDCFSQRNGLILINIEGERERDIYMDVYTCVHGLFFPAKWFDTWTFSRVYWTRTWTDMTSIFLYFYDSIFL